MVELGLLPAACGIIRDRGAWCVPQRGKIYQPRATPWVGCLSREKALKGRDKGKGTLEACHSHWRRICAKHGIQMDARFLCG